MLIGDFGMSYTQGEPVGQLIAGRLGVTLPLTLLAMILSAGIGLPDRHPCRAASAARSPTPD